MPSPISRSGRRVALARAKPSMIAVETNMATRISRRAPKRVVSSPVGRHEKDDAAHVRQTTSRWRPHCCPDRQPERDKLKMMLKIMLPVRLVRQAVNRPGWWPSAASRCLSDPVRAMAHAVRVRQSWPFSDRARPTRSPCRPDQSAQPVGSCRDSRSRWRPTRQAQGQGKS